MKEQDLTAEIGKEFFEYWGEKVKKGTSSPLNGLEVWIVKYVITWIQQRYMLIRK